MNHHEEASSGNNSVDKHAAGPSGTQTKVVTKVKVPLPVINKKQPSKPQGKELVGGSNNNVKKGKDKAGLKVKNPKRGDAPTPVQARIAHQGNQNSRWVCGWATCHMTCRPIDHYCWQCGGEFGTRGDQNGRPLPNQEPKYVYEQTTGSGIYRGRGGVLVLY